MSPVVVGEANPGQNATVTGGTEVVKGQMYSLVHDECMIKSGIAYLKCWVGKLR